MNGLLLRDDQRRPDQTNKINFFSALKEKEGLSYWKEG